MDKGSKPGFDIVVARAAALSATNRDDHADRRRLGRCRARYRRREHDTSMIETVTGQCLPVEITMAPTMVPRLRALHNVSIAYADEPPFARLGLAKHPAIVFWMRELRGFKRVGIAFRQRKVLFGLLP